MHIRQNSTKLLCSLTILGSFSSGFLTSTAFAQTNPPPWVSLFDGTDLKGWSLKGSTGQAWVQDGQINCRQTTNTTEHTFVCTEARYGDFILEVDVKVDGTFNSGILFRCVDMPKGARPSQPGKIDPASLNGYQVKIDPTPRKWTGGIYEDFGGDWKWYYSLEKDARAQEAFKIGEWNTFRIEAIGNSIKVWVNGVPTANMTHDKYGKGYIAFKIHSLANTPGQERVTGHFKNIRIITEPTAAYLLTMDLPPKAVE